MGCPVRYGNTNTSCECLNRRGPDCSSGCPERPLCTVAAYKLPRTVPGYTIGKSVAILVVEDDEVWWPEAMRIAEDVAAQYRNSEQTIVVQLLHTYEDTIEALKAYPGGVWSVLMVLDLG